ncbi:hypothetical protein FQA39_LY01175 [Lamprigera yunnana]|nr:hypothetical protein FQA39_LY01175 [Lamprigera yunnana]
MDTAKAYAALAQLNGLDAEIRSRLKKKEDDAAVSVPQEETQTATPPSTDAKVKCEAELEPSQRETEVTQLNTYATAASEVATNKLETTAENSKAAVKELDDNDSSTDATVALATSKAAEDEEPLDNEHDVSVDETQEEEPEQSTAAVEEESLSETENDEMGREKGIPEGEAGELEEQVSELLRQVLPTVQCDLRPTECDPRQQGESHTNGGVKPIVKQWLLPVVLADHRESETFFVVFDSASSLSYVGKDTVTTLCSLGYKPTKVVPFIAKSSNSDTTTISEVFVILLYRGKRKFTFQFFHLPSLSLSLLFGLDSITKSKICTNSHLDTWWFEDEAQNKFKFLLNMPDCHNQHSFGIFPFNPSEKEILDSIVKEGVEKVESSTNFTPNLVGS